MHISKYLDWALGSFLLGVGIAFVSIHSETVLIVIVSAFIIALIKCNKGMLISGVIFLFCIFGGLYFSYQYPKEPIFPVSDMKEVHLIGQWGGLNKKEDYLFGEFKSIGGFTLRNCFIFENKILTFINSIEDFREYKVYVISGDIKKLDDRRSATSPYFSMSVKTYLEQDINRGIKYLSENLRVYVERALSESIPEPVSSLATGFLVGGSSNLPNKVIEDFRTLSLSHILAVSGYNVTIIATIATSILITFLKRKSSVIYACLLVIFFCFVAGLSASVVRAGIMGCLTLAASVSNRFISPNRTILLAAGFMSIHNPLVIIYDIGFQLSFLAVIGLLYLAPFLQEQFKRINYLGIGDSLATTISAQVMVLPLIGYYFGSLSILGIVANLLVTPLIPYVMALSSLAILFYPLSTLISSLVAIPALWLGTLQLSLSGFLSKIPLASVSFSLSLFNMCLFYIFLIFLLLKLKDENSI